MILNFQKVLGMVSVPNIHHPTAKSTKQRYSVETVSCGARRVPLVEREKILDSCVLITHSDWHSLATYVNYNSTEYQLRMGDSSFYYTLFSILFIIFHIQKYVPSS